MVILAAQYYLITVQGQEVPIQTSLQALRSWSPRPLHLALPYVEIHRTYGARALAPARGAVV